MPYSEEQLLRLGDFFAYNPASRHRRRIISELLAGREFQSVLDVGCGDGNLLAELKRRFGCRVYGLESERTPRAEGTPLDGYYPMDISKERPDRRFDAIVCSEVLEHIPDHEKALGNIAAVCGRYLLLTVPAGPIRATDRHMGHLRHYSLESLRRLAESCGFRVLKSFAWGFPFHSLYKLLQDVLPGAMIRGFGAGRYGPFQRAVCRLLYGLFFLNWRLSGCQLFLLGERRRELDSPGKGS